MKKNNRIKKVVSTQLISRNIKNLNCCGRRGRSFLETMYVWCK